MVKGKPISMVEIMDYIQQQKRWTGIRSEGQDTLKFGEFKNMIVFDLCLTSDNRKIRELWKMLVDAPMVSCYNQKNETIIFNIVEYNFFLSGMHSRMSSRGMV